MLRDTLCLGTCRKLGDREVTGNTGSSMQLCSTNCTKGLRKQYDRVELVRVSRFKKKRWGGVQFDLKEHFWKRKEDSGRDNHSHA